jgi:hypothetical protein
MVYVLSVIRKRARESERERESSGYLALYLRKGRCFFSYGGLERVGKEVERERGEREEEEDVLIDYI